MQKKILLLLLITQTAILNAEEVMNQEINKPQEQMKETPTIIVTDTDGVSHTLSEDPNKAIDFGTWQTIVDNDKNKDRKNG